MLVHCGDGVPYTMQGFGFGLDVDFEERKSYSQNVAGDLR